MSHSQKKSGSSVTVHHLRSPPASCGPFPMYKDGEHFPLPCKIETSEPQHAGASSCIGVNSETALEAQLAAAPRAILTESPKKNNKKTSSSGGS